MKKISLLLIAIFAIVSIKAQVKLAPVYTDNMVIQQNAEVPIWGFGSASETITITASWSPKDTVRVKVANNGQWSAVLKTPSADLVAHSIKCNNLKIDNVMLGEVWLCSGQSNMEWCVNYGISDGEKEAMAATYPNIRILKVPRRGAETPQLSMDARWVTCTPETMRDASAVGYFFARSLHKNLNVPIGFISAAWGGTPAEPWVPIEKFDDRLMAGRTTEINPWWPNEPAQLYNQMINPIVPFTLAGAIWYQGESNRMWASNYDAVMKALITGWREKFNKNLPFYFVQIAPFEYNDKNPLCAAELREAQEKTATTLENTGMVVVSDIVDNVRDIHPRNKQDVGARLANFALAEVYKKDVKDYKSPTYGSMTVNGNKALISFKDNDKELVCTGKEIEGFKIAGDDGVFVEAQAKIKGAQVEVWSDKVKKPLVVRYCFDETTFGNLKTVAGLPVAPFRTDRDF